MVYTSFKVLKQQQQQQQQQTPSYQLSRNTLSSVIEMQPLEFIITRVFLYRILKGGLKPKALKKSI